MPDELGALRTENLSLQKNISRLESELEKRSSALENKTLQCDKKEIQSAKENLKLQRQNFQLEQKIVALRAEIEELKKNANPSIAEIMAHAAEQLKKAKLKKGQHSYTPETPDSAEEDAIRLDALRSKFKEFSSEDEKADT